MTRETSTGIRGIPLLVPPSPHGCPCCPHKRLHARCRLLPLLTFSQSTLVSVPCATQVSGAGAPPAAPLPLPCIAWHAAAAFGPALLSLPTRTSYTCTRTRNYKCSNTATATGVARQ